MSVTESNVIDGVVYNKKLDVFYLVITDHLEWEDVGHLSILKNKIETYVHYFESGQLIKNTPKAQGKKVIILILAQYSFDTSAISFFEQVRNIITPLNIGLEYRLWNKEDELLK